MKRREMTYRKAQALCRRKLAGELLEMVEAHESVVNRMSPSKVAEDSKVLAQAARDEYNRITRDARVRSMGKVR